MKGTIKKKTDKGFGFIEVEGQDGDVFFHAKDCDEAGGYDALNEGDIVEFGVTQGEKGPRATNLQKT